MHFVCRDCVGKRWRMRAAIALGLFVPIAVTAFVMHVAASRLNAEAAFRLTMECLVISFLASIVPVVFAYVRTPRLSAIGIGRWGELRLRGVAPVVLDCVDEPRLEATETATTCDVPRRS